MKKSFITIAVVVILACAMVFSASAASFEYLADDLNALGLFRGTDAGYDLDRAPNRGEGLVMLIRLLGLEEEALAFEGESPFGDVPAWLAPYAAYAFENKLTTGTSDTTFTPGGVCSAQMYVTFVLRALGYSDAEGGDFTYAGALDFGKSVGIIDDILTGGDFLRDQMVAVSYLALSAAPKGGEFETLFEKLAAAGALAEKGIDALAAKQALFAELKNMAAALIAEQGIAVSLKAGVDPGSMGAILAGAGFDLNIDIDMDMSLIGGDDISAALGILLTRSGEDREIDIYLRDGTLYTNMDGEKSKTDFSADAGEAAAPLEMLSAADAGRLSSFSYLISGIDKGAEDGLTVYSIKASDALTDVVMDMALGFLVSAALGDSLPEGVDLGALNASLTALDIKLYSDAGGMLSKFTVYIEMSLGADIGGLPIKLTLKVTCDAEVTATGGDVVIEFPDDLDEYGT